MSYLVIQIDSNTILKCSHKTVHLSFIHLKDENCEFCKIISVLQVILVIDDRHTSDSSTSLLTLSQGNYAVAAS